MSNQAVPSGWRAGHISDIASVNPSVSVASLDDQDAVSFLTMADVGESGRILNHQIRQLREVRAGFTRFEEGDILFAKITPCMENGKGAFARNLVNCHGFGSTEFHVLRANDRGDPEFVYHLAQSTDVRTKAIAFFTGSAGQQRVDAQFFYRFPLLIPPPPEQRKIARILTTLNNLIEKTESLIAKYQAIKQGMMHDLFTRGVDENGHLRPAYEEAPALYKPSELGWIPKEWEVRSIDSLAVRVGSGITPTGGSEVYLTEGVIFIRSQNVASDGLDLSDVAYIESRTHQMMAGSEVFAFDVLLNITGASIGRCCFLPSGLGLTNTNQHVCCIRIPQPNEPDGKFVSSVLASPIGQNQIFRLNAGGNREGLNYQQLRSFVIPWPSKDERLRIATRLTCIERQVAEERKLLEKLRLQKTGLMQDLLTGKVRVKVDAAEEVAP